MANNSSNDLIQIIADRCAKAIGDRISNINVAEVLDSVIVPLATNALQDEFNQYTQAYYEGYEPSSYRPRTYQLFNTIKPDVTSRVDNGRWCLDLDYTDEDGGGAEAMNHSTVKKNGAVKAADEESIYDHYLRGCHPSGLLGDDVGIPGVAGDKAYTDLANELGNVTKRYVEDGTIRGLYKLVLSQILS